MLFIDKGSTFIAFKLQFKDSDPQKLDVDTF